MQERLPESRAELSEFHSGPALCETKTEPACADVPGRIRHALAAECMRVRHLEQALACATDGLFRTRCKAELASSKKRVQDLEFRLRATSDAAGRGLGHADAKQLDGCLLSAMEPARANGDPGAAEAVAQECLALLEIHCRTLVEPQRVELLRDASQCSSLAEGAGGI